MEFVQCQVPGGVRWVELCSYHSGINSSHLSTRSESFLALEGCVREGVVSACLGLTPPVNGTIAPWLVLIIDLYSTFYKPPNIRHNWFLCGHTHHFTPITPPGRIVVRVAPVTSVAPLMWHGDSLMREVGQFVISSGGGGGHAMFINKSKGSTTEKPDVGSRLGPQVW